MRIIPITELSEEHSTLVHERARKRLVDLMIMSGRGQHEDHIDIQDADFLNPHPQLDLQNHATEPPILESGILKFTLPSNGFAIITYVGLRDPIKALSDKPPSFPIVISLKTGPEGNNTKATINLQPLWIPTVSETREEKTLIYPCKGFLADPVLYGPGETAYIQFTTAAMEPSDFSQIIIGGLMALPWFPAGTKNAA